MPCSLRTGTEANSSLQKWFVMAPLRISSTEDPDHDAVSNTKLSANPVRVVFIRGRFGESLAA